MRIACCHQLRRLVVVIAAMTGGCARAVRTPAVTSADIPSLTHQAEREPRNAGVRFRLAAALAEGDRCDTAVTVARAARLLEPGNVLGPLVVGACQEGAGRYGEAVATYNEFAAEHPQTRGIAAVLAKAQLALRASADQAARRALAREAELAREPPEPRTIAVLPLVVAGDTTYQALSRGLAELITTDLAYVRSLRLLERVQVGVLLDELRLSQSDRVDPGTAARVGRLLRAERMVQGTATFPRAGPVELVASVVGVTGVVRPVGAVRGPFKELLGLEKRVVLDVAAQLGIQLTEGERQRILRQGPRNLAAFLAYSRGLEAMDRGDYAAAARSFRAAVRADPSFQEARQGQQAAEAAPLAQRASGGALVALPDALPSGPAAELPASGGLLSTATSDVVPTISDAVTQATGASSGSTSIDRQLTPETSGLSSIIAVASGFIIIFKRPP